MASFLGEFQDIGMLVGDTLDIHCVECYSINRTSLDSSKEK
jgi:hypothetical protein